MLGELSGDRGECPPPPLLPLGPPWRTGGMRRGPASTWAWLPQTRWGLLTLRCWRGRRHRRGSGAHSPGPTASGSLAPGGVPVVAQLKGALGAP